MELKESDIIERSFTLVGQSLHPFLLENSGKFGPNWNKRPGYEDLKDVAVQIRLLIRYWPRAFYGYIPDHVLTHVELIQSSRNEWINSSSLPVGTAIQAIAASGLLCLAVGANGEAEEIRLLFGRFLELRRTREKLLTPHEKKVLRLIAKAMTNAEIAKELVIQESTVKSHANKIFSKLNLRHRTEAAFWAIEQGLAGRAKIQRKLDDSTT